MNPELQALLNSLAAMSDEDRAAHIAEMSDEELADLEAGLVGAFDERFESESRTADDVEALEGLAGAIEYVRAEGAVRAEAAEQAAEAAAALRDRVHPAEPASEDEDAAAPEGDTEGDTDDAPAEGDAETTEQAPEAEAEPEQPAAEPEPQRVAASASRRPTLATLTTRRPSAARPGPATDQGDRVVARVEAQRPFRRRKGRPGQPGDVLTTMDELTDATLSALSNLRSGERQMVASIVSEYPESRRLTGDPERDTAKIDAVVAPAALVAAGGICGPLNTDYSIDVMADDSEPIAASLPNFNATRGGLRFIKAPTMASVGVAGTRKWTVADDEATDPTDAATLKPVQTIVCGEEETVVVDAYPTRLRFGNLAARFSPEIVAANTELALANAARFREVERLRQIFALSTEVTADGLLGATRDTLTTLDRAAAAVKYRNRLGRNTRLSAIFPYFALDMFRADLTMELAHDRDGQNNLALSDADVTALIAARGIDITWTLDAIPTRDSGGTGPITFDLQGFGAQADRGALSPWPAEIVFALYPQGTFQNLDGGEVNFGVIRDSVLDAANDYETMIESFFAIAKRGAAESLVVVQRTAVTGASAGTVATV